jgi:hypothetical protein
MADPECKTNLPEDPRAPGWMGADGGGDDDGDGDEGETRGGDGGDGGGEASGGSVATTGEGGASDGGVATTGGGDDGEAAGAPPRKLRRRAKGRKTGSQGEITRRMFRRASGDPV